MNDVPADGFAVVRVDILTAFILNIDVDPGVLLDVGVRMLIDEKLGVAVDMSADTGISAMDTPAMTLEFVVGIAYAGDALTDVSAVPINDVVSGINEDMFVNETVNGLAAAMTPSESTVPSP